MNHRIRLSVVILGSLVVADVVHASDAIVLGSRLRVEMADVIDVAGLIHAEQGRTVGMNPHADEKAGTVTVTGRDGGRVTFPEPRRTLVGEVVAIDDETLVLRLEGRWVRVTVPLSSIVRAERGVGRTGRRHGRGALIGLGIGSAAGALVGLGLSEAPCPTPKPSPPDPANIFGGFGCITFGPGARAAVVGILGGVAGALAGGLVGAGRTDKWSDIKIRETSKMKLSMKPLGRSAVSLRLTF